MATPTLIAIAVVERGGEFLIGPRPEGVPLAGLWEFPGGKVQPDETPAQAACRECLEEAGLEIEVLGEHPSRLHSYAHSRVDLRFFACRPREANAIPLAPFRYVPRAELTDYEFPPANRDLLAILLNDSITTESHDA